MKEILGGRQEDDPPPEGFAESRCHQCYSQWVRRKTNYQRTDCRVRRTPLPSLLQMDIIKPLAGEWGLMTLSGSILGLHKRWKIKLHSKLQPACSRAAYQQCDRNQGQKKRTKEGCFFQIHLIFLLYLTAELLLIFEELEHHFCGLVEASREPSRCGVLNDNNDLRGHFGG